MTRNPEPEMVERLTAAVGSRLISVLAYGPLDEDSAVLAADSRFLVIVLGDLELATLRRLADPVQWWLKKREPWPRVFSTELLHASSDVYPIEHLELRDRRRAHEREVFTEVAKARARLLAAHSPAEAEAADGQLQSAIGRLLAISERYPELKANENFLRLQDELAGTENRIAVERMRYNNTVRDYNTRIRRFPSNLVASATGFDHRDYFEATPGARKAPRVQFGTP